ncbi:OTOSP protein, partial [Polypterus senegalus]
MAISKADRRSDIIGTGNGSDVFKARTRNDVIGPGTRRDIHWAQAKFLIVVPYDESPALPYWSYSTNDFWRYIEYFRSIGAYHHINNMARTFFAHQPLGDTLGYEVPVADEEH